jgi:hypothetical protein
MRTPQVAKTIILQMDKIWDPKKSTLEKNDQLVGRNAQLINYDKLTVHVKITIKKNRGLCQWMV